MDLYLVRHAIAEPRELDGGDDPGRSLTADGVRRLRAVCDGLDRLGVEVDAQLASPYARAWQTAEVLAEELGWPAPERLDALSPPAPAARCVEALGGRREASLALVGHEPNLSELTSLLLAGDTSAVSLALRKAGVVCLRAPSGLAPGSAVLQWCVPPRILRRLGRSS